MAHPARAWRAQAERSRPETARNTLGFIRFIRTFGDAALQGSPVKNISRR